MADADRGEVARTHLMLRDRHLEYADEQGINLSARVRSLLDEDFEL